MLVSPCSDLLPMPTVSWTEPVHKRLGKGLDYREIVDKFGVVASTTCEKLNTAATEKNLFRLVPVPGH